MRSTVISINWKELYVNNVMLDLETFGTIPGSVIRSLGAVVFDPDSDALGAEFYMNIDDGSCLSLGLTKDKNTVDWWAKPDKAQANKQLLTDQKPILTVLKEFGAWFIKNRGIFLWGQGANFDEVLLACAYRAAKMKQPWQFSDARDTRTAYDISKFNTYSVKRQGTYHNALDDAKHQSRCVQASYRRVAGKLV